MACFVFDLLDLATEAAAAEEGDMDTRNACGLFCNLLF